MIFVCRGNMFQSLGPEMKIPSAVVKELLDVGNNSYLSSHQEEYKPNLPGAK